jgi:Arc/MetJ-type ribon-helix-helix transcriptional regulator
MRTNMISVRMPGSLVEELRKNAKTNHFMDLSEEIRFIIKQNFLKYNDPYEYEIKRFKDDIKKEINEKNEETRIKFVNELRNLLDEMKHE